MNAPVLLSLTEALARLQAEPELFVVYDANVAWVASQLTEALPVRASMALETSEEGKTLETVQALERWLLQEDASRGALLLAVGGGITTDLVGFAAAIYKRGIRYANVPTTLLAQVDAAIGGKTGVNLDGYKNMLGAFRMPECTVLEAAFLRTLPAREFRCGLAELLKTFLIGDADAYAAAISLLSGTKKASGLKDFAVRAAEIKAEIVRRDPLEHGERAVLNLGHTFGHAIEHCSDGQIAHGEAVGMGVILAAKLSEGLGLAEKGLAARLKADFESVGLDVECQFGINELAAAMKKDKKDGKFVLLKGIGEPVVMEVSGDDLCKCTK
jgi:3-dehydroquinate synthase